LCFERVTLNRCGAICHFDTVCLSVIGISWDNSTRSVFAFIRSKKENPITMDGVYGYFI